MEREQLIGRVFVEKATYEKHRDAKMRSGAVPKYPSLWYNSRKRLLYGDFSGRPTAMAD